MTKTSSARGIRVIATGYPHCTLENSPRLARVVEGRRAPARSPLPNAPIGALLARVGRSGPFFVGSGADVFRAPIDGPVHLRVNDDVLTDNRGEFRVTVSVGRLRNH